MKITITKAEGGYVLEYGQGFYGLIACQTLPETMAKIYDYFKETENKKVMEVIAKKGFTLIELIIVILIFGLLIAIAIPAWEKVNDDFNYYEKVTQKYDVSERELKLFLRKTRYTAKDFYEVEPVRNNFARWKAGYPVIEEIENKTTFVPVIMPSRQ